MIDKTPKGKPYRLTLYPSQIIDLLNSLAEQAEDEQDSSAILALFPMFEIVSSYLDGKTTGPELAELLTMHSGDHWTFFDGVQVGETPTFTVFLTTTLHGSRTTGVDHPRTTPDGFTPPF